MPENVVWKCIVRQVNREWKEELYTESVEEASLLSGFGRLELIGRAAARADAQNADDETPVAITRVEFAAGPTYQFPTDDSPDYYSYRYFVYSSDGSKNEWELRCIKSLA